MVRRARIQLFLIILLILKINCGIFYDNDLIEINPIQDKSLFDLETTYFDFNYLTTSTNKNSIELSYDLQANQLLDYLNANKNLFTLNKNILNSFDSLSDILTNQNENKNNITKSYLTSFSSSSTSTSTVPSTTPSTQQQSTLSQTQPFTFTILNLKTTTTKEVVLTSTEKPFLFNSTTTINTNVTNLLESLTSTVKETDKSTRIPYKKIIANSIFKEINETFRIENYKNYKNDNITECLNCSLVKNSSDCKSFYEFDNFFVIDTFCCQCNPNA